MWGVLALIVSHIFKSTATFASFAMAGMCKQELVEPPSAISTIMAFSKAFWVIIVLAVIPFLTISTTFCPLWYAILSFSEETANAAAHLGRDIPNASVTHAIVF